MEPKISEIQGNELDNIKNWYNSISIDETENLKFDFTNDTFYKMKKNEDIIGIMSISIEDNRYKNMKRFILKKDRNNGFGERFLDYLIKKGEENNIKAITAYIKNKNTKGIQFLENKGFRMIKFGRLGTECYKTGTLELE